MRFTSTNRMNQRPKHVNSRLLAVLVPLTMIGIVGCSTTDEAASQVCTAQANVSQSYEALRADVNAGNFGDATTELGNLAAAIEELDSADQGLDAAKKAEIQEEVAELNATLASLGDASNAEELGAALDSSAQQLQSVIDAVKISAEC